MSNPRLTLRLSSDGLSAFVTVATGSSIGGAELDRELQRCGIVCGIAEDSYEHLAEALADENLTRDEFLLASGWAAEPGQDAWFEVGFAEGIQAGHLREDGSVDYHERDLLKPVVRGDVLGVLHAATPGKPGQRVNGEAIAPAPGRKLELELRSGVQRGSDSRVLATRDGAILYKADQYLDVVTHHIHQGPVDLHSGNLRMQGSLVIKGDVKHPFSVVATGDVDIHGNVDSATVRAGGGLRVHGGVRGGDGSALSAEGDMTLRHAESAELKCGARLQIQEAINSQLSAAHIHALGRLRGGRAAAESLIVVKEAGSTHGVETRLTAGEPLLLPLLEAQRIIAALKTERMAQRAGGRNTDRAKGGKLGRARAGLDLAETRRLAEHAKRREQLLSTAFIQIGVAHAGVTIQVSTAHVTLNAASTATRYCFDKQTSSLRAEKTNF